jgi:hypothetical protein
MATSYHAREEPNCRGIPDAREADLARDPLAEPAQAVMAVFQLLSSKITEGEIEDVHGCRSTRA